MAADFYYPPSKNAVQKTLAAQLLNTATTGDAITFSDVDGIQNKPGVLVINRVDQNGTATPSSREFISYSGTSGNTVLIETRNVDSSASAKTHAVGSIVEFVPDVILTQRLIDQFKIEHEVTGAHKASLALTTPTLTTPKIDDAADFEHITTPANPSSGRSKLYPKSDEKYYTLTSGGTEAALATESYVSSNGGKVSLYQNALINGAFDVWQRATTFTPNDDVFTADRWNVLTETNGAWTIARDTDVPASLGFKYSAKLTNVTLNNQVALVQILENVDSMKLNGQAVSLSFYAKTTGTEIGNLRATVLSWASTADAVTSDVIGTWASDGTDPTWATNWTAEVAGSNKALTASWTRYTIENIAIDTASMANIAVVVWLDDGTVAANDDFWITGVQLNQGTTAATFNPRSYTEELRACQRYYRKSFRQSVTPATNTADQLGTVLYYNFGTVGGVHIPFELPMRTTPTVTTYNPNAADSAWRDIDNNAGRTAVTDNISETGFTIRSTTFSAGAVRNLIHWTAEAEL